MKPHEECYGRLFPSVETVTHENDVMGKVFGYRVTQPGLVTTGHATTVDMRAWEQCAECQEFDSCYRLSVGKLLMELATRN